MPIKHQYITFDAQRSAFNVYRSAFTLLLLLLAASCVREQRDECTECVLTVKAVDTEGNDLTGTGAVTSVDIYLFNEKGFVRRVPAGTSSDFLFGYEKQSEITLVAWGNVKQDSLEMPEIPVGTPIGKAQLSLVQKGNGYHLPVTDLFYTRQQLSPAPGSSLTRGVQEETLTLVLERCAAAMSIRTRYMAQRFGNPGTPCTFIVRGTADALNFLGQAVNDAAGYEPESVTDETGDGYAAPFRVFPTGEQQRIEVDIMRQGQRLVTLTEDSQGKPLYALAGKQLNVDVDFRYADIKVTVTVVPWGEVSQDTEF